ncbi:MAG: hypothetical protein AAF434_20705 [Pseudomonadota bacterium]
MSFCELKFPAGLRLLSRWQQGESQAFEQLKVIFDAALSGQLDDSFREPAPEDAVHACGSIDLMTLTIMNSLYGLTTAQFYKGDPLRYVRSVLVSLRLLGMPKTYLSWPVYGFTAEALGQIMIYSDKFSPGTDPEQALVNRENWRDVRLPNLDEGMPALIANYLDCYVLLTGHRPVMHLAAPYSLAAEIYGQEPLIAALTHEPEFANQFLDHLVDEIHSPWLDRFFRKHPDAWAELSDASGSPFFIGPGNCKNMAIRSVQRLRDTNPWGSRVYVANYRGDYVIEASSKGGSSRRGRQKKPPASALQLQDLFDLKHSVCRDYTIRLADDRVPISHHIEQSIKNNIPLFTGIGAKQIDRHAITDLSASQGQTKAMSLDYVDAIKTVAHTITQNGYQPDGPPWPGTMYFEDVSAESSFELVEVIVGQVLEHGSLAS